MANLTLKVLDNSFISACITDINSINLINECCNCYKLLSSLDVYKESTRLSSRYDAKSIEKFYNQIELIDMSGQFLYDSLFNYLVTRYPYLHSGELSIYLTTLLLSVEGNICYLITDDMQFRRKIPFIQQDTEFIKLFGGPIPEIQISGTLGIIRRMLEKNILTANHIEMIILELEKGSFFLTPDLKNYLRGISS